MPVDLENSYWVDRYGAQAILGVPAARRDINSLDRARMIFDAYEARRGSGDWVAWAQKYPEQNKALNEIMIQVTHGKK